MKQDPQGLKDELRMLAQRLSAKGAEPHASFGQAIERYRDLAEQTQHIPALNDALGEQAALLMSQGRYCEALQIFEDRLAKNPADLMANLIWRKLLNDTHSILCKLAHTAPETAEYGRTYEKLLQMGYVSTAVHLGAIRHYLISGQIERAAERLLALARIAPHGPGIADAINRVSKLSDDVRVQTLRINSERKAS